MKKTLMTLALGAGIVLSGCTFGAATEDEISNVLSEMHEAEKPYRDGQKELQEIEKSEQQLFNQTMELTQEQQKQLKENIAELEEMLEQRLIHIEDEEKSMQSAMDLVNEIEKIEEKSDAGEKEEIGKLKDAIKHRYETHAAFIEKYKTLSNLQQELYEMLLQEDMNIAKLEAQVEEVNAVNKEVTSAIKEFNEATVSLNKAKDEAFENIKHNKSE